MRRFKIGELLAALTLLFVGATASFNVHAQITIQPQPVASSLALPNYVTSAKDGTNRLFIVLKGGIIKVRQTDGTTTDFLNITSRVLSSNSVSGEQGLLGMAFHPQYALNRRFFVYYTRTSDGAIQIAEYAVSAANPNVADTTEKIIITIPHPTNSNHNGGMVEFGPDGYLYFGPGDGGSANDPPGNAQNLNVLLGKIIRLDVNVPVGSTQPYLIPPDNPFAGATPGADEIYTYGMRNPFRFSFDRGGTQQLYIGDVGQGAIEEIDIGARGGNYGWRAYEGNSCTNIDPQLCAGGANPIAQTPPIFQYNHTGGRCSITGGYVYRGRRGTFPQGAYIYGDYCTGEIWMLQGSTNTLLLDSTFLISSFGEDESGEIYVCTNSTTAGTVQRLVNPSAVAVRNVVADFDGDFRTDISVFRPSNGTWYFINSFANTSGAAQFGQAGDRVVPGDYDADGKTDFAVFRPSNGVWYLLRSTAGFAALAFGQNGDIPVAGDFDGDGATNLGVFRPSNATWYYSRNLTNPGASFVATQFGISTDTPVAADYDGDGKTDIAVFRAGAWYALLSQSNSFRATSWGQSGDTPVVGDYDGDGKADVAVWRNSTGVWYALQSSNNALYAKQWGQSGDTPAPGDYDGDGKTDPTVTRSNGGSKTWYVTQSFNTAISRAVSYGVDSDTAVPTNDVP